MGQIKNFNENDEVGRWEVQFVKRSQLSETNFVDFLPNDQQIDDIDVEDILCELPDPCSTW